MPDSDSVNSILRLTECPQCDYDLRGLPTDHTCPECGFEYDETMFILRGSAGKPSLLGSWSLWAIVVYIFAISVFGYTGVINLSINKSISLSKVALILLLLSCIESQLRQSWNDRAKKWEGVVLLMTLIVLSGIWLRGPTWYPVPFILMHVVVFVIPVMTRIGRKLIGMAHASSYEVLMSPKNISSRYEGMNWKKRSWKGFHRCTITHLDAIVPDISNALHTNGPQLGREIGTWNIAVLPHFRKRVIDPGVQIEIICSKRDAALIRKRIRNFLSQTKSPMHARS